MTTLTPEGIEELRVFLLATDPHGVDMRHYGAVPATSGPYIDCEDDQPLRRAALRYKEQHEK
jgi:hypothetical protein